MITSKHYVYVSVMLNLFSASADSLPRTASPYMSEFFKPVSKYLFIIGLPHPIVIPAQAGIHVFQGLQWTPAFAGVTDFLRNYLF
jgi:hypothetical protein